jgi:hypothetical protein
MSNIHTLRDAILQYLAPGKCYVPILVLVLGPQYGHGRVRLGLLLLQMLGELHLSEGTTDVVDEILCPLSDTGGVYVWAGLP